MSLGDQLEKLIADAVREALEAERPRILDELRAELAREAKAPTWLRPSEVRTLARCSSAAVFDAIKTGTLPATEELGTARLGIPARRWKIDRADALAWASGRRGGDA